MPRNGEALARLLAPGTRVGRYQIVEVLGQGGMGVVYRARDAELERDVALKVVSPDQSHQAAEGKSGLLREAQALARLSHPNVIAVYDVGSYDDEVFIATELVEGDSLTRWLEAEPRTVSAVLEVFRQAGRGLAAAHAVGLVHRDFKSQNVMVGVDGRAHVLDFSLARVLDLPEQAQATAAMHEKPRSKTPSPLDSPLEKVTAIDGALPYLAAGQYAGEAGDARSDQFAFCVTLYEALYGERPFSGPNHAAAGAPAARVLPPPRDASVPPWIRKCLLRGLAVRPEDRYPSMAALLAALDADPALRRRQLASGSAWRR